MEPDESKGIKGVYIVGGCVRDEILGVDYNDIDYAVETESYEHMRQWILSLGGNIFVDKPDFCTIRASINHDVKDFVMCRKDGPYTDKRRPDYTLPGTLLDDLSRRDFTVNALAKDLKGNIIDHFGGLEDIKTMSLKCVQNPSICFLEDPLRLLRAFRFHLTKGFVLDKEIEECLNSEEHCMHLNKSVSVERKREEIMKCMKFDTIKTIIAFNKYQILMNACFDTMWLKPTNEKK